jgi:hypothetical protein
MGSLPIVNVTLDEANEQLALKPAVGYVPRTNPVLEAAREIEVAVKASEKAKKGGVNVKCNSDTIPGFDKKGIAGIIGSLAKLNLAAVLIGDVLTVRSMNAHEMAAKAANNAKAKAANVKSKANKAAASAE